MSTPIRVGLGPCHSLVDVDPDQLTPRARALAEVWARAPLGYRAHIMLESAHTLRELGATEDDAQWYGGLEALDHPHRIPWASWPAWPVRTRPVRDGDTRDGEHTPEGYVRVSRDGTRTRVRAAVHEYLEACAAALPVGYYPVGLGPADRVPSADVARDDVDLITKHQVMELLRELGRPISAAVLDNYRSRPAAGWPQPVEYVGRTPRWSRTQVEEYARKPR